VIGLSPGATAVAFEGVWGIIVKNPSVKIRGFQALDLGFFIRKSLFEHKREYGVLAFHPPGKPRRLFRCLTPEKIRKSRLFPLSRLFP
jgi:hypothetical protein